MTPTEPATLAEASFDVFLSHNSRDKPTVRRIGRMLQDLGISVWLDEWELIPGRPWQDGIEEVVANARSAVVAVGGDGLGAWEKPEMRAFISEFVSRGLPVIPTLLPGAPEQVKLPVFLSQFTRVDLRSGLNKASMDRLVWGITGRKPGQRPGFTTKKTRKRANLLPDVLNYYTYISKTKLEMLYAQIETGPPNNASAYIRELTDISKLKIVVDHLRNAKQIGDFRLLNRPLIEATFPARVSYYGWSQGNLVLWIGEWLENGIQTRVALGGSGHHMVGNLQPRDAHVDSSSATPAIELALSEALGLSAQSDWKDSAPQKEAAKAVLDRLEEHAQPFGRPVTHAEHYFTSGLALAASEMAARQYPVLNINTIFRVLGRWRSSRVPNSIVIEDPLDLDPSAKGMDLILGTPLFVALR
jgi:hypothetical protein